MKYTPNREGIAEYMRSDPDLKRELLRRAQLGLSAARAMAPERTGALKSSGHVSDDGVGGFHHDRMQVSVTFDVAYTAAVTFPKRYNRPTARDYLLAAVPLMGKRGH